MAIARNEPAAAEIQLQAADGATGLISAATALEAAMVIEMRLAAGR